MSVSMSIHNPYIYYGNNDSREEAEEADERNNNNYIINSIKNNTIKDKKKPILKSLFSGHDTTSGLESRCKSNLLEEEVEYLERHCRRLQIEVAEKDKNIMFLKEQQDRLQEVKCVLAEDMTCSICIDARKTHAFNLCGHLCVCKGCGEKCVKCPICRAEGILLKIIM